MVPSNRTWLPNYCDPKGLLPMVQETRMVFRRPPYLFQDFVAKALAFVQSDDVAQVGFAYDPKTVLPCKWRCADECLFGVDLCLFAFTGHYPFDKGKLGGIFNEGSVAAAVRHSPLNLDFGGSHTGYIPGPNGGTFGHIQRPLRNGYQATDCGAMMTILAPFKELYDDACLNVLLFTPKGGQLVGSVPNEFLHPSWSSHAIKLLIDVETFAYETVDYDPEQPHTRAVAGRSLFRVMPTFLEGLTKEDRARFSTPEPTPIGPCLTQDYFNMFDENAVIDARGVPESRLLPYVKHILASRDAPSALNAAVINTNIEYNRLADCVRSIPFRNYAFACFTGVFIDLYDEETDGYVNLFEPVGVSIKPVGHAREIEFSPDEVHDAFDRLKGAAPAIPIEGVLGHSRPQRILDRFTFQPGKPGDP